MQQTEHYKLNLIEMDDPISPLPLNENTQVLDRLVAGIAGEQHLFRLGKVELTEANGPISLDLSGADLTKYDALFMLLYRKNDSGTCFMTPAPARPALHRIFGAPSARDPLPVH